MSYRITLSDEEYFTLITALIVAKNDYTKRAEKELVEPLKRCYLAELEDIENTLDTIKNSVKQINKK